MDLKQAKGDWALITGASSGIGREFALQLAAAGMNVVLVARRADLLNDLNSELSQTFGVQSLAFPFDLSNAEAIHEIKRFTSDKGLRIRLLVNNAAFARWGHFEMTGHETYREMIMVNAMAMVSLCHLFLPDLISFPSSAIINISSPAALNPVPYMAVYAATKAFVHSFSQALYGELRDRGVLVQTVVPGPTETHLGTTTASYTSALRKMDPADEVVRVSLAHLAGNAPLALHAKGTYKQRIFSALFPAKTVIHTVARMFQPAKRN